MARPKKNVAAVKEATAVAVETAKETIATAKEDIKVATVAAKNAIAEKKAAAPKKETAAKKTTKIDEKIFIQFSGKEATPALLVERAKDAFVQDGGKLSEIKSVSVYLKPEEGMVYYVINDSAGRYEF